jgi:hypothetical protein
MITWLGSLTGMFAANIDVITIFVICYQLFSITLCSNDGSGSEFDCSCRCIFERGEHTQEMVTMVTKCKPLNNFKTMLYSDHV